jgi:hypothetical protein
MQDSKTKCVVLLVIVAAAQLSVAVPAAAQQPDAREVVSSREGDTDTVAAPQAGPTLASGVPAHPWFDVAPASAPDSEDEGWQFSFAPYAFLSSVDGELRARDRVVEVDRSFGDITEVLKFAAGFRVEAQEERWGLSVDNNYFKVGDDVTTDRGLVPDFRFDLAMNVTEFEGTYRLWGDGLQEEPVGGRVFAVDALGGVRLVHLSADLEVRRLVAADTAREGSSTYVHAYLGNRFVVSPSKYVSLIGRYNVALASDFSWFVHGGVEVRPWEHFALGGGLQVLDLSLEKDDSDAALDARFAGPVLFLKFHF